MLCVLNPCCVCCLTECDSRDSVSGVAVAMAAVPPGPTGAGYQGREEAELRLDRSAGR